MSETRSSKFTISSKFSFSSKITVTAAAMALSLMGATGAAGLERTEIRIGGTGAGLGLMRELADAFQAERSDGAVSMVVLPSLGSSGGIRALGEGAIDLAISARRLKERESAKALNEVPLATSPLVFVSSRRNPPAISSKDIAGYYAHASPFWPDGKPLRVILRPKSDTDSRLLDERSESLADAIAVARKRNDLLVAATDQDNAQISAKVSGSLSVMTLAQLMTERLPLSVVPLNGSRPTLQDAETGAYGFVKRFYLIYPAAPNATIRRFLAFVQSDAAGRLLRASGSLPTR